MSAEIILLGRIDLGAECVPGQDFTTECVNGALAHRKLYGFSVEPGQTVLAVMCTADDRRWSLWHKLRRRGRFHTPSPKTPRGPYAAA